MSTPKVLIVDDSECMRRILCNVLNTIDSHVLQGTTAQEGLGILLREPVDLLITNWNMLETSGLEFTREVRSLETFQELPILILSNRDSDTMRREALMAGVDAFVGKSAPFDRLRAEVLRLLKSLPELD